MKLTERDLRAAPYVSCSACGAQPFHPCRDAKYRRRAPHAARVRDAREQVVLEVDGER